MREGRRRTAGKGTEPDSLSPSPLNGAEFCVAEGFSSLGLCGWQSRLEKGCWSMGLVLRLLKRTRVAWSCSMVRASPTMP